MTFRPRGSLARTLHDKCLADERLNGLDKSEWYHVDVCHLPEDLQRTFVQLSLDDETQFFLDHSIEKSSWVVTQIWHCLAKTFLNVFLTQTSINGLLRRGSMFVFSRGQFLSLTDWDERPEESGAKRLLDLGAGDGVVTSVIAKLFQEVYATEVSQPMRWILAEKGFKLLDVEKWATQDEIKFDVVSCLNLLDRCDRPYDILMDVKKVLKPNGILILAMVLPFKPYVEVGRSDHVPSQALPIQGLTFEEQVASVVEHVLQPAGYVVVSWSKVPYLCEGDLRQSYYWLDDAIFILKPA